MEELSECRLYHLASPCVSHIGRGTGPTGSAGLKAEEQAWVVVSRRGHWEGRRDGRGTTPSPRAPADHPHLPQLLTRGLVLGPLTQVFHALVLGQEVLLRGLHLVTVPLVEQFAVGQRAEVGLAAQLRRSARPRSALV